MNKKVITGIIVAVVAIGGIALAGGVIGYDNLFDIILSLIGDESSDNSDKNSELTCYFYDVGQGDCEIITNCGQTMLIDGGEWENAKNIIAFLQGKNITKLDYVVCTHPHSDHVGATAEILENFEVGELFLTDIPEEDIPTTFTYEHLLETIDVKNIKVTYEDCNFKFGDADVSMWFPKNNYSSLNSYSIATKVVHGENSFLFTGDAEKDEEKEMLESGFDVSAKVFKMGHHCSNTSNSKAFLEAVNPQYAFIELGKDNKYHHPHKQPLERISEYVGDNIYRTDENGTITCVSNGKDLTITCEKSAG